MYSHVRVPVQPCTSKQNNWSNILVKAEILFLLLGQFLPHYANVKYIITNSIPKYEMIVRKVLINKKILTKRYTAQPKVVAAYKKVSLAKQLTAKGCCYTALVNSKTIERRSIITKRFKLLFIAQLRAGGLVNKAEGLLNTCWTYIFLCPCHCNKCL